jgi:uncharacterized protein (DUF433 family)
LIQDSKLSMSGREHKDLTLYGGHDPRELPAYPLEIAARTLLIPKSTLNLWVFGDTWTEKSGIVRSFKRLIAPPDPNQQMLSFVNLVEAHVLKAIRRRYRVQMIEVRDAIEEMKRMYETQHPLADIDLLAGGANLFVADSGLLNVGMGKQVAMEFLRAYLSRIDRNLDIRPIAHPEIAPAVRLYPFVVPPVKIGRRVIEADTSRLISIDPYVYFGRPVITGTGIPTDAIAERFWGGDSIDDLVKDFERSKTEVEYAIRYETQQLAISKSEREPSRELAA